MVGSLGKNKVGQLEAHFKGKGHDAMRNYIGFINRHKSTDALLKSNHKKQLVKEEYVLNRKRGENGNFYQFVQCVARHSSTLKAWLENRNFRRHYRFSI